MTVEETAVIVVGAGPVGLCLAIELGLWNVPCVVFDERNGVTTHPKANTHTSRSMEHYRRLGVAQKLRRSGLPADYPGDVTFMTRLSTHELARVVLPSTRELLQTQDDLSPEPQHRASQIYLEPLLLERARELPTVRIAFQHKVTAVYPDASGIRVEGERSDGTKFALRGLYLVGCDGPQSPTRHALGIAYKGDHGKPRPFMGGRMFSVTFRSRTFYSATKHKPAWMYWTINPLLRSITVAIDGESLFLWHTQIGERPEPSALDVPKLIEAAVGAPLDIEVIASATWRSGQGLVAERFSDGRCFIAGDAAHLFTPTGGFGLNTGIDDIANLGWKLAAAIQGWGGRDLLASYDRERRPLAIRNTLAALDLAEAHGKCPVPQAMESNSDDGATARAEVSDYLRRVAHREFMTAGIQLGGRYDDSPIIVGDGAHPPQDDPTTYVPTACPGGRAPHLWRDDGQSLFDQLHRGFTLLRIGADAPDTSAWFTAAQRRNMPLKVLGVVEPKAGALYDARLALIRPDQYVAWRGNATPASLDDLLARVVGD